MGFMGLLLLLHSVVLVKVLASVLARVEAKVFVMVAITLYLKELFAEEVEIETLVGQRSQGFTA